MKNRDWLFKEQNGIYGFRSAGVLISDSKILIQRGIDDTDFAIPGGHVAWGETSAETLVREYKEELGVDIIVDRLIWVEEVFWEWGAKKAHSICHYHLVSLKSQSCLSVNEIHESLETNDSRLIFKWVDINELKDYTVYPIFIKDKINNISGGIEHFVSRDWH